MKQFMDEDFLLRSDTAKHLYHDYAENMPIIDYHCHLSPQEICEDRQFTNITQVWLGGDHYKWRIMRAHGIEEKYITGNASDKEKFQKWAEVLSLAIGNPLYHWTHMELKKFFGYQGILNADTAEEVWKICNDKLKTMKARDMICMSGVTHICTTDDPVDDLHWHQKIREDDSFHVHVLPAWRPDQAMSINKPGYINYLNQLSDVSKTRIDYVMYEPADPDEVNRIFLKRLGADYVSEQEEKIFRTAFMKEMGREYAKRNWVMQLHFGVIRDNNRKVFDALGPDAGIDAIGRNAPLNELAAFLNCLAETDELPKTILYSLNPNDNTAIETIMACFQDASCVSKLQHGAAWWFNDHQIGMKAQMTSLACQGMLADFVGMLTDSRSFLSYARHDYFRRVLCDLIGEWVENGEYPCDEHVLKKIIQNICYNNAKMYFGF